jgi:hypothetical protein
MRLRLKRQEDLTPWIPIVLPLLAVFLAVCVYAIDAAVLAPVAR